MGVKRGYKQTQVGLIPEDWEIKRLSELVTFINGKAHENYIKDDGNYIVVNSKFISSEGLVRKYTNHCLTSSEIGSILMVMSDVPKGRAIAKCFMVDKDNFYAINQRVCSLKAKSDNPRFLFYLINRNKYFLAFDDGVQQTNLRKHDILGCPLSLPPTFNEQTAIATVLSDVDSLINNLEKLIAKKRNIKKGAMQQLLTGKKRLPGFSKEWETERLGEIADISKGSGLSKSKLIADGDNKCILYGELFTTYDRVIRNVVSRTNSSEGIKSKQGDVLLPGSTTTIGIDLAIASALLEDNVLLGGDIIIVRKRSNDYNSEYLAWYLTQITKYAIAELTQGITIIHLHGKDLLDLEIEAPPVDEQTAIAEVFSDLDSEIEAVEKRLSKYRLVKQGMMQELLTGKKRLM